MKKILERYQSCHRTSSFCELGSFRDILHYNGHEFSLAMVFGLSSAMGFGYGPSYLARPLAPDYYIPLYVATPFTPFPLRNGYRVTNVWTSGKHSLDPEKSWNFIKKHLNEDRPVMVEVESNRYFSLLRFPAFSSPGGNKALNIGGHVTVVMGYDDEKDTVFILDVMLKNPLEIKRQDFQKVCSVFDSYIPPENEWIVHFVPKDLPPLKHLIYQGIQHTVHQMLHPYKFSEYHYFGLAGLRKFSQEFGEWPELMDDNRLYESLFVVYNFAETMCPKGGFLRKVQAEFLKEAAQVLNKPELNQAASLYETAQYQWNRVTPLVMEGMKDKTKGIFNRDEKENIAALFNSLYTVEEEAVLHLQAVLKKW